MKIVKGRIEAPVRAVAYGPEGIGKSTLASLWPVPLFVDAEAGTLRLAVDRVQPLSWAAALGFVEDLAKNAQGYRTLVFDTADWLEKMAVQGLLAEHNQKSIEAFGYGKGYTYLAEEWKRFLDRVGAMQAANGMHVLFLAHAIMRKFEQPDEAGAYDRWEMKLSKQVAPAMKEWADLLLFANYKTIVVDVDGKKKAQGGARVLYATHHACWDAKNRFGLPDEMPLPADRLPPELAAVLGGQGAVAKPAPAPASAVPAAETPPDLAPAEPPKAQPAASPAKAALLVQLGQLMTSSGVTKEQLGAELARRGIVPADMNPREYNEATLGRIVGKWAAVKHNIELSRQQSAV